MALELFISQSCYVSLPIKQIQVLAVSKIQGRSTMGVDVYWHVHRKAVQENYSASFANLNCGVFKATLLMVTMGSYVACRVHTSLPALTPAQWHETSSGMDSWQTNDRSGAETNG